MLSIVDKLKINFPNEVEIRRRLFFKNQIIIKKETFIYTVEHESLEIENEKRSFTFKGTDEQIISKFRTFLDES